MLDIEGRRLTTPTRGPTGQPADAGMWMLPAAFLRPRAVVRATDRTPGEAALWLGALAGVASLTVSGDIRVIERVHGDVWSVLLPVVLAAPVLGVAWVYAEALWTWLGARALGEAAPSVHHLASAAGWGGVPLAVLLLPVKVVVGVLWWQGTLVQQPWAFALLQTVTAVGTLWSLGATGAGVGEVLGTTTVRGLLAYAMVPAVVVGGLVAVAAFVHAPFG